MKLYRSILPLAFLFLLLPVSKAQLRVPAMFTDNMVLQCDMKVPIWGWATPGEKLVVQFDKHRAETIVDPDGKWKVRIGPLSIGGPYELLIFGQDSIRIKNVLVGEVWVCSGQSNMAMEVRSCRNAEEEISEANYPDIRHFQVKRYKAAVPQENLSDAGSGKYSWLNTWEICDPSTVGHFSGSGYFFALELHKKRNVPLGIIHASWGGTTAEAWTPADTLENDPKLRNILRDWPEYNNDEAWLTEEYEKFAKELEKARLEGSDLPLYFNQPSVLFNGIMAPVLPFGIRGVLWYQGESNAYRACQYRDLFPAMITQWRKKWGQGDFPFLFVQLANYHFEPQVFPELREAQTMALSLPATAMALAIDIGDSADIHPKNKQEVGRRLALAAQATVYEESLNFSGPVFKKMFIDENSCWILFDHLGDGLVVKGDGLLKGFTICGPDSVFTEAEARIEGQQVIIWNEQIKKPLAVRYAWANHPGNSNLYNKSGDLLNLPASPFRTDQFPEIGCSARNEKAAYPSIDSFEEEQGAAVQDLLLDMDLYSETKDIVNGTKWNFRKQYKGNPFLAEGYWPYASLKYKGKEYTGFQINYDLQTEDFILLYPGKERKKYIVLSKDKLESFSYTDTINHREHLYVYMRIPGTKSKELYETVYKGRSSFILQPKCEIVADPSETFPGVYSRSFDYYIQIEGNYERVHSKKTLLKTLHRNVPEVKKYIRKNHLKINKLHPENIVRVLQYYDELYASNP